MNEQVLIDKAWNHLSTTKQKSIVQDAYGNKSCSYAGTGCAFRPAIDRLNDDMEGDSAFTLINEFQSELNDWARFLDGCFADKVQNAHDFCYGKTGEDFVKQFATRLSFVVKDYGLQIPATMAPYLK